MLPQIVVASAVVLCITSSAIGGPTEGKGTVEKATAATLDAAKQCNIYVPFEKGDGSHCLLDPVAENAVPLTVFDDDTGKAVRLIVPGREIVLQDSGVHSFTIEKAEFYAIHKCGKVIIVNATTGQTGVMSLKP